MNLQTTVTIVESVVKTTALVVGAVWAYRKFVVQRESEPATDIDIDVRFIGIQDEKWIVEITSTLQNKSQVRLQYKEFRVRARYLRPEDKIEDGKEDIRFQLLCPKTIDERLPSDKPKKLLFANVDFMNPKQEFRHRYITFIPAEATFLWVTCSFYSVNLKGTRTSWLPFARPATPSLTSEEAPPRRRKNAKGAPPAESHQLKGAPPANSDDLKGLPKTDSQRIFRVPKSETVDIASR